MPPPGMPRHRTPRKPLSRPPIHLRNNHRTVLCWHSYSMSLWSAWRLPPYRTLTWCWSGYVFAVRSGLQMGMMFGILLVLPLPWSHDFRPNQHYTS
jgi:hypothetical protein